MTTQTASLPHPVHVSMIWITCHACGVAFGLAQHVYDQRQRDGESFYCTNGHGAVFRELEAVRLKRELESTQRALTYAREDRDRANTREAAARRQASAQKANVTKLKRRAEAGVCAHCNRTFENVARHMKTKHAAETK